MDGGSRKANWTESEISLLVEQVEQKKEVLKRKFSTSLSATDKSEAWTVITDRYRIIKIYITLGKQQDANEKKYSLRERLFMLYYNKQKI